MAISIGHKVPDIQVEFWQRGTSSVQQLSLRDYKGRWVVLFFYVRDFSYICPTELSAFAGLREEFEREDTAILAASTDSYFSHEAWFSQDEQLEEVAFPVIADTSHRLTEEFGILVNNGSALRGTFIIDPDGMVRHISINDLDIGRNVDETLRVLRALQSGELCPVGWHPGQGSRRYNDWLAKVFPRVKTAALIEASNQLNTRLYEAGDVIIHQGGKSDQFYILVSGEVSVIHRRSSGEEVELAQLGEGDVFGEVGILAETRRTADVRANTPVSVLALGFEDFRALVDQSDPTARDFMRIVEQRRSSVSN
ncbi:MAG: redoxin domain-containing protein [Alphaproteobacteria bacterium]|nr:redoxin domain-containing protein [Alphaproteobacteria bacterium]